VNGLTNRRDRVFYAQFYNENRVPVTESGCIPVDGNEQIALMRKRIEQYGHAGGFTFWRLLYGETVEHARNISSFHTVERREE
jgi:hypothetical protein